MTPPQHLAAGNHNPEQPDGHPNVNGAAHTVAKLEMLDVNTSRLLKTIAMMARGRQRTVGCCLKIAKDGVSVLPSSRLIRLRAEQPASKDIPSERSAHTT